MLLLLACSDSYEIDFRFVGTVWYWGICVSQLLCFYIILVIVRLRRMCQSRSTGIVAVSFS